MKIIYYSPHPTHDIVSEVGYSTHQRETIAAMRALGHELELVIMGGTEKQVVQNYHSELSGNRGVIKIAKKLIPKIILNSIKDFRLIQHDKRACKRLAAAIAEFKPDLVYERNEYMQDKGCLYCKKNGVKHYLEINSPVVEEMRIWEGPSFFNRTALKKERNKINHTDKIFAVSSSMRDFVLKTKGKIPEIKLIPNCINPEKVVSHESKIELLKSQFKKEQTFIFGFVGSIFPYHGVDLLIRAFAEVVKEERQAYLLIVGDGYLRKEYEELAKNILPVGSYHFAGKIPHNEIFDFIQIFDVAIMPASNWYGSPIKIFEYGFMGKGIIAPDTAPVKDVMEDNQDGLLTNSSVSDLSEKMNYAIHHFEKMEKMGQTFRAKILKNYTWKKQAEFILSEV